MHWKLVLEVNLKHIPSLGINEIAFSFFKKTIKFDVIKSF